MSAFAIDYYLLVFVAGLGVVQIASSFGQLKGLLFLKSDLAARGIGSMVVVATFVWFFSTDHRNINDYEGGLDANIQAILFFMGAMSAMLATVIVSSVINVGMSGREFVHGKGFEELKRSSYARALIKSLRYWGKEWRTQTKSYFCG